MDGLPLINSPKLLTHTLHTQSNIIHTMKHLPSPQDIREAGILGAYFFSDDTLRFFGQTMRSFKTEWHDKNKDIVRLFAPSYDSEGRQMHTTNRLIDVSNWRQWKEMS